MSFVLNRSSSMFILTLLNRSSKLSFSSRIRHVSSDQQRPLMLMDLPRIVYPNILMTIKNFFSRIIITGYFDSTFAMQPFCDGARQALTVVSRLIGNNQFEDLTGFVTREVINEVKQNYQMLPVQQKQKIPVEESEIVFTYPYEIGIIMDDKTNSRHVEISMIFHVLKDRDSYREEFLQATGNTASNWAAAVKKMRDNVVVCNYKFLRDMSKNAQDDSWTISGLNHWLPSEYQQQQQ